MGKSIQPIRGMNDILPEETSGWQYLESVVRDIVGAYGYREIRIPILERTELFRRSIGELTDIVEKEMYTFTDRSGDSITLRPEATAGCVRASITHGLLHNRQQRIWCAGPMFRYERPQKGRYRQFHQVNVEALGFPGPDVDAELILIAARLWQRLGLEHLSLKLNSLGTTETRADYRSLLVEYFSAHSSELDEDSLRRLDTNPLRILDSKNPSMRTLIDNAPSLLEHLDSESAEHFAQLRAILDEAGLDYVVEPRLVRGLDYYTRTVFEWVTDRLGAQDAVCSGGRYDALVEQLGGKSTPAIGWAMGVERAVELMKDAGAAPETPSPHVYLVMVGAGIARPGVTLAERLRDELPALRLVSHCGGGSFKSQMRQADRSGAAYALILGEDELARRTVGLKPLRADQPQQEVGWDELGEKLASLLDVERRVN